MLKAPGRATRRALAVISTAAALFATVQLTVIADTTSAAVAETNETPILQPAQLEVGTQDRRLVVGGLTPGGRFGSPEAIGDVNGDGVGDLAVGAFSDDTAGTDVGAVHILLMAADGGVASTQKITSGTAGFGGELLDGGGFGFRVAGIGDLDGDGIPDIVASAYRSGRAHVDAGEIWVLFLEVDGTVKDWQVITEGFGEFSANLREGDQFGVDVASVGDLDGDGSSDIAVGMWKRDGLSENEGGVLMLMLAPDGTVRDHQEISAVAGWADATLEENSGFSVSVEALGDVNADGTTDLAVGSIGVNSERGVVWLMTLTPGGTASSAVKIKPGTDATPVLKSGARFGSSIANLGDVDGNGAIDIAVGAFGIKDFEGAVFVLQLDDSLVTTDSLRLSPEGLEAGDLFGHTIASVGDINGNGSGDLAIGAPGDDAASDNAGAVHLVSVVGQVTLSPEPEPEPSEDTSTDDDEGEAVPPQGEPGGDDSQDEVGSDDQAGDERGQDEGADDATGDENSSDYVAEDPEPVLPPEQRPEGDLDGDGIRNDVEGTGDIDGDGIPNREDLDTDGDGILDSVEGLADADADGVADFVEVDDDGDGDGDGIATIDEGTGDADGDGVPNHRDTDTDNDGVADGVEGLGDTDGDGIADMFDEDSDGDGTTDRIEGSVDSDGDGLADRVDEDADNEGLDDRLETAGDSDGDGIEDRLDTDSDNDGLSDGVEGSGDTDGDGLADSQDDDSDDDGLSDADEGAGDTDGDGTPDNLDTDADNDGVSDADEGHTDTDQDGLPDNLDTDADNDGLSDADEGSGDVDGDATPNNLDTDADNDGVSDAEEGQGDSDDDGIPNFLDRRRANVEVAVVTAASIVAGEVTEVQLEVVNRGPDSASGATARLSIPEGLQIDAASTPDDCSLNGCFLTCELGDLAVAQTASRSITAQVLGKTTDIEMAATVRATEGEGQTTTGPLAVLDSSAVRTLADGVRSEEGALVVVVLTAILCGGIILSLTREEPLRRH